MIKKTVITLVLLIACAASSLSHADSGTSEKTAATAANSSLDLSVPESPAFKILGLTPNKIDRPSSPREFAASIINGIDTNGNFQSGIALDTAPYLTFKAKKITLDEYQQKYWTRFLSRSQFSFATAKGGSDTDKSLKMATGLKFTPWDEGDPRNDEQLMNCLKNVVANVELSMDADQEDLLRRRDLIDLQWKRTADSAEKTLLKKQVDKMNSDLEKMKEKRNAELNEKSAESIKACRNDKKYMSNVWNKSSWAIGIAPAFITTTGNTRDFKYSGLGAWTSVAYGIEDFAQIIGQVSYRNKNQIPDPNSTGAFIEQDNFSVGTRFRFGTPNFNGNLEGMYVLNDNKNGKKDDDIFRYSAGIEFKVTSNFWLTMNIGSETGNSNGNKLFALGDIKWAYESAPVLSPTK